MVDTSAMGIIQLFIQSESWKKNKNTYTKQLICVHSEFVQLQSKIRTLNKALTCKQSKFSQLLTKSRNSYLFYNGLQEHSLKSFTDFIYFPYPKLRNTSQGSLFSTASSSPNVYDEKQPAYLLHTFARGNPLRTDPCSASSATANAVLCLIKTSLVYNWNNPQVLSWKYYKNQSGCIYHSTMNTYSTTTPY